MGYRDFAGPMDCSSDSVTCLDKDEVAYAKNAQQAEIDRTLLNQILRRRKLTLPNP